MAEGEDFPAEAEAAEAVVADRAANKVLSNFNISGKIKLKFRFFNN